MKNYITALTIAGSDSCGGAGIQADIKTFSALGCYGMSVLTMLTAQNTKGIKSIHKISSNFVQQQLESIFSDIQVKAVKTGLLINPNIIKVTALNLKKNGIKNIVIDPVMIGKNKQILINKITQDTIMKLLFPIATLITPNIDEAEHLLKISIKNLREMINATIKISNFGCKAVLLKGGHLTEMNKSIDCLYIKESNSCYLFEVDRIKTINTHGAGCTLSAAITAFLAQGYNLITSIQHAKKYVTDAILFGKQYKLGSGPGPTCHHLK